MQTKRALISGVTRQDGSNLTALVGDKGYEMHRINTQRADHIYHHSYANSINWARSYNHLQRSFSLLRGAQLQMAEIPYANLTIGRALAAKVPASGNPVFRRLLAN